jgi:hypothetical protein
VKGYGDGQGEISLIGRNQAGIEMALKGRGSLRLRLESS